MKIKGLAKGVGGTAIEGLVGGVTFYGHRMLSTKIAFIQNKPLAAPIGMVVLGHVLKKTRKFAGVGMALVGAGGYAAAQVYELKKAQTAATPPAGTSGFDDDTGALTVAGDIGALTASSDIGAMDGSTDTSASAYDDAQALSAF
jgi:hypothetical protein